MLIGFNGSSATSVTFEMGLPCFLTNELLRMIVTAAKGRTPAMVWFGFFFTLSCLMLFVRLTPLAWFPNVNFWFIWLDPVECREETNLLFFPTIPCNWLCAPSSSLNEFLCNFFWRGSFFKVFIEFVPILFCFMFCLFFFFFFLAMRHMGSKLPDQGLNPHSLHWKVKS